MNDEGGGAQGPFFPSSANTTTGRIIPANFFMTSAAVPLQSQAVSRDAADRLAEEWMAKRLAATDANDFLYAFEASRDYDPSPALEKVEAAVTAVNSADDEVNPPELGILEREIRRLCAALF